MKTKEEKAERRFQIAVVALMVFGMTINGVMTGWTLGVRKERERQAKNKLQKSNNL